MNMSFYSAAVGAYQQNLRMQVQGNNIANVNTQGFRAERAAFGQLMNRNVNGIDGEQLPKGTGTRMIQATVDFSSRGYMDRSPLWQARDPFPRLSFTYFAVTSHNVFFTR